MSTDDETDLSPSLSAKYESPAKAEREALKQTLQKEGLHPAADSSTADLKKLQLSMLKHQVAGLPAEASEASASTQDGQTKKDRQTDKKPSSFVTKTREQEIAAQKLSADTKVSSDQMVEQGKQAQNAQKEMQRQGDIQSEGG